IGGPTELLTYLVTGSTIVLHRTFDAHAILQSMQDSGVTAAHLAPTMIQMVLEVQEKTPYDLSKLHTIIYASAPMSVALSKRARAAFGPVFMQIYGMSELGLGSVLLKHQHILDGTPAQVKRLASAGQPYLGTDMKIVGKDGKTCAVGETGDLLMRSKALMQGYWNRPEQTREAMPADGFLRTGDMGYFDDEGFLFIVDRKKDMVVSGGENIYSREVEEVLLQHPAVAEAAVVGVPDPKWGESVMAFLVLRPGMQVTEEEVVEHCKKSLASYKKPKFVRVIDVMPRVVSTNKIDKRALRAPFWAGSDRQVG
ncbi:MAG: AMP-binding protein, partial [Pseudomonadota bacterium]